VGAVLSGGVVEALPFSKLRFKVDVAFVAEQRIEFLLVGSVRPLALSIQPRRTRLDIGMPDALFLDGRRHLVGVLCGTDLLLANPGSPWV